MAKNEPDVKVRQRPGWVLDFGHLWTLIHRARNGAALHVSDVNAAAAQSTQAVEYTRDLARLHPAGQKAADLLDQAEKLVRAAWAAVGEVVDAPVPSVGADVVEATGHEDRSRPIDSDREHGQVVAPTRAEVEWARQNLCGYAAGESSAVVVQWPDGRRDWAQSADLIPVSVMATSR